MSSEYIVDYEGFCPVCNNSVRFRSGHEALRDFLLCNKCEYGSVPRERALALALKLYCPDFLEKSIHECSPNNSGISRSIRLAARFYVATQYYKDTPAGQMNGIYRSENLEAQTFEDESFDIFLSLDVFEHIFDPEAAIKEIWRTLKPGGIMASTWPIRKYQTKAIERRAQIGQDGDVIHFKEPEIHGNPIDGSGALVTIDYGYDIHKQIALWAPFDVSIIRFADRTHGVLGEYTDTIFCKKYLPS